MAEVSILDQFSGELCRQTTQYYYTDGSMNRIPDNHPPPGTPTQCYGNYTSRFASPSLAFIY